MEQVIKRVIASAENSNHIIFLGGSDVIFEVCHDSGKMPGFTFSKGGGSWWELAHVVAFGLTVLK